MSEPNKGAKHYVSWIVSDVWIQQKRSKRNVNLIPHPLHAQQIPCYHLSYPSCGSRRCKMSKSTHTVTASSSAPCTAGGSSRKSDDLTVEGDESTRDRTTNFSVKRAGLGRDKNTQGSDALQGTKEYVSFRTSIVIVIDQGIAHKAVRPHPHYPTVTQPRHLPPISNPYNQHEHPLLCCLSAKVARFHQVAYHQSDVDAAAAT